jgi:hypothetical protein
VTDRDRIVPPAPTTLPDRIVAVPPTVQDVDNSRPRLPKDKNRADFRKQGEDFRRLIEQHGKHTVWRKAMLCPCFNEQTGQVLLGCTQCDGDGYVFVDPINVRAHMASFDRNTKIYEKFGMWIEGATAITVEAQYRLHYRDKIELCDALMPFNELLKKNNRRGPRSVLPVGRDSARYRIVNVTKLMTHSDPLDPTSALVSLEAGFHFEVDDNGWLQWLPAGDNILSTGDRFSILYDFHPVYQVISHPHVIRDDVSGTKTVKDTVISLPLQAAAKLDFLVDVNTPVVSED